MCTAEAYGRGKALSDGPGGGMLGVRFAGNAMSGIADKFSDGEASKAFANGAMSQGAGQGGAPRLARSRNASRPGSVLTSGGGGGGRTILGG